MFPESQSQRDGQGELNRAAGLEEGLGSACVGGGNRNRVRTTVLRDAPHLWLPTCNHGQGPIRRSLRGMGSLEAPLLYLALTLQSLGLRRESRKGPVLRGCYLESLG